MRHLAQPSLHLPACLGTDHGRVPCSAPSPPARPSSSMVLTGRSGAPCTDLRLSSTLPLGLSLFGVACCGTMQGGAHILHHCCDLCLLTLLAR
jgi:hypothetical protein